MSNDWLFTKEELLQHYGSKEQMIQDVAQARIVCKFLQDAGQALKLPQLTIATAIIFFHRFFAIHKFKDYDKFIIAQTCLFLAGKVEETPKKLRDVLIVCYKLRYKDQDIISKEDLEQLRKTVLHHEFVVLKTLRFDLTLEHPYKFLLTYVKSIHGNRNLAQVAWNFVNDSLRTTVCLQYPPHNIATAAIYLASKFLKYNLPEGNEPWWEVFDARLEDLEDISNQILDLYEPSPNVDALQGSLQNGDTRQKPSDAASSSAALRSPNGAHASSTSPPKQPPISPASPPSSQSSKPVSSSPRTTPPPHHHRSSTQPHPPSSSSSSSTAWRSSGSSPVKRHASPIRGRRPHSRSASRSPYSRSRYHSRSPSPPSRTVQEHSRSPGRSRLTSSSSSSNLRQNRSPSGSPRFARKRSPRSRSPSPRQPATRRSGKRSRSPSPPRKHARSPRRSPDSPRRALSRSTERTDRRDRGSYRRSEHDHKRHRIS